MGSSEEDASPPIWGEYMHPVITEKTDNGDAWERKYFAPPSFKPLVPRTYPITDVRPLIANPQYSPLDHLKRQGFGIVTHHSAFLNQLNGGCLSEHAITQVYHPEIKELVRKTTGCKEVFIVGSVFRQGKRAPEAYNLPTERKDIAKAVDKDSGQAQQHKLAGQSQLQLAAPIRVPHMDFTPLGARQAIRFEQKAMYDVAMQAGIIAAEDALCLNPATKASDRIIAEGYNNSHTADSLGPRYAAYSIWRPLRKVERDPLTLAPRSIGQAITSGGELVHHFYENKIPGSAELNGDFLKEYAMLGVKGEKLPVGKDDGPLLNWFYVSRQQPHELLFIKLFDSAALGADAQHAGAPWHASPETGGAVLSDEPRESIDIRVVAIW